MKTMRRNLFYFYQLTKNSIRVLFISGVIYYTMISLFFVGALFLNKDGTYKNFDTFQHHSTGRFILGFFINVIYAIILSMYSYYSTESIDFVLYVRAWMYGHGILDKFENMSYLISRSCFYRMDISSSLDASESIISQELDLKLKESIENDEMTGDYKISAQTFTSYSES